MPVLLGLAAVVGVVVSLAAWGFLELINRIQIWVFTDIPKDLGYQHGAPLWFYVVVLGLAGLPVAFAIVRLPGRGGRVPAEGLKVGCAPTLPIDLPGVVLAALATVGLGIVLGPESPLIALEAGLGLFAIRSVKRDAPAQAQALIAASGSFAAVAMIFGSPIIAAVILIEALGWTANGSRCCCCRACSLPGSDLSSRSGWARSPA
jgi:H+/Cl- antiporter ClcA